MFRNSVKTIFNFLKIKNKLYNVLDLNEFQICRILIEKIKKAAPDQEPPLCIIALLVYYFFRLYATAFLPICLPKRTPSVQSKRG
jgi:hypothetical protein